MYNIGKNFEKKAGEEPPLKKKRTLNIVDFKKFKYMEDVQKRYSFGKSLGQGAFGVVRYATHRSSKKVFAAKVMTKR